MPVQGAAAADEFANESCFESTSKLPSLGICHLGGHCAVAQYLEGLPKSWGLSLCYGKGIFNDSI